LCPGQKKVLQEGLAETYYTDLWLLRWTIQGLMIGAGPAVS
jgi:hypothetical protein